MIELTKANIEHYAARYDDQEPEADRVVEQAMKETLKTQRFLTKPQFVQIGIWKSPRARKWYEANDEEAIKEITTFSFSAKNRSGPHRLALCAEWGLLSRRLCNPALCVS